MVKFVVKKTEKEVISLRISSEILQIIDKKSADAEISRNEFIVQAIQFALSNMEDPLGESD
ncbi:MAG: ribbon-helix-helix protein, CopG family [Lachnospiraceae bacterium]|nr:ribbon-helix-helix protein, CopG family [Lachnospiraceae bacterium]